MNQNLIGTCLSLELRKKQCTLHSKGLIKIKATFIKIWLHQGSRYHSTSATSILPIYEFRISILYSVHSFVLIFVTFSSFVSSLSTCPWVALYPNLTRPFTVIQSSIKYN